MRLLYYYIVNSELIRQPWKFQNVFYRFIYLYIFYVSDAVIKYDQYAFWFICKINGCWNSHFHFHFEFQISTHRHSLTQHIEWLLFDWKSLNVSKHIKCKMDVFYVSSVCFIFVVYNQTGHQYNRIEHNHAFDISYKSECAVSLNCQISKISFVEHNHNRSQWMTR